jgi:glycosyltransferase involved in cell wall biosynthesis
LIERPEIPVCVVIPAYNRTRQISRCLSSVWAQHRLRPKEVIVVDDHSTDDTAAVAASLGARVIRHTENLGPAQARNTGLQATNCEWIAFLDSDDEWLPHHLAHLWSIRGEHALVGSGALYRSSDGRGDRYFGPVARKPMEFASPDRLISTLNFFTTSGSMVRRDAALAVGGFHRWWGAEDFDLWVRVLERYTGICSRCVTVFYHMHDAQVSLQAERMLEEHRKVVRAHLDRTGNSPAMLERWEATVAWDRLRAAQAAGRPRRALRYVPDVLAGRQRLIGLASQFWLRFRVRRRTYRLDQDGGPSIAVLVRGEAERSALLRALNSGAVRDLSDLTASAALVDLLRRPAGLVITSTRLQIAVLRLTGNRAVLARRVTVESARPARKA